LIFPANLSYFCRVRLGSKDKRTFRTILVVDDDETVLRAYTRAPEPDVTLLTAADPPTALRIAREHRPELIIVDLQLGNQSGIELVRELKANDAQACIVLISGYGSVDATVLAIRAGAEDVIAKPVTYREIILRLEGEMTQATTFEPTTLEGARWEHIQRALGEANGNVSLAARKLGVYRTTLRRWLRRYAPRH
jgi:two-component system response regulator RegA